MSRTTIEFVELEELEDNSFLSYLQFDGNVVYVPILSMDVESYVEDDIDDGYIYICILRVGNGIYISKVGSDQTMQRQPDIFTMLNCS
jgi:hypothetical protein